MIRITKHFDFETGHALYGYDGKCKNVHGHSYKLWVTVIGKPISDVNNVKLGMVIDFGDLKKIVKEERNEEKGPHLERRRTAFFVPKPSFSKSFRAAAQ